jgi:4-amino-4-deoxy-L-arabinose transferase-like glycosyltransferase
MTERGTDSATRPAAGWRHVLVLLGALWLAGILTRGVWTPDEPREYALAVNLLSQDQLAVPMLAGRPFAEKPPLTYWLAAATMKIAGRTPLAARIPNLLYGLLTVWCTAQLVAAMLPPARRRSGALLAAIVGGTAWLSYLHTVWLATDAPLLAASALAWLGAWRGLSATDDAGRWRGSLQFHLGLALAFLAKNLLGLLAPLMALVLFIAWERRWREWLRWQWWAGAVVSVGLCGAWLLAVSRHPDGARLLRMFLWDNSIGRFLPVASTGDYRSGHQNSPGKLISEVALGLLPWLPVALAAWWVTVRRAWRGAVDAGTGASGERFLTVAAWPLIILLSFSSTVRDVYALPCMVPLTAAIALWWARRDDATRTLADRVTTLLMWILGAMAACIGLFIGWLGDGRIVPPASRALAWLLAVAAVAWSARVLARRWPQCHGLGMYAAGLCTALCVAAPVVERGQDLRPAAQAAVASAGERRILLAGGDETMAAALDYGTDRHGEMTDDLTAAARRDSAVVALVQTDADRLTPEMHARLQQLGPRAGRLDGLQRAGEAGRLLADGWRLERDLALPGGRHYQLLTPPF